MPLSKTPVFGNLMSYKFYVRPETHRLYGSTGTTKSKHQQNVHDLLRILFVNGNSTTWDMAKTVERKVSAVREQEKSYRRLLVGRIDRNRRSGGILDIGLVIRDKDTGPYAKYRLSLYGILYCIDVLQPTKRDIDRMAAKYSLLLPRVFGRWEHVKSVLGPDAYNLQVLSKGLYLNNSKMAHADNPLYELMSYIHIKYRRSIESISEHDLAEQTSYWFYTYLLYRNPKKLKKMLNSDGETSGWYVDFFKQAKDYYTQRLRTMQNSDIF